ncbi:MAG: glucosylceramidase [Vicingaceae bacterium]|jgi:glucosylceramidase
MNIKITIIIILLLGVLCNKKEKEKLHVQLFQTSAQGDHFEVIELDFKKAPNMETLELFPERTFQKVTGYGGAFTEASAYLLNKMSAAKRKEILEAYFAEGGANYTLTRTHINSCDFSLANYSYAEVANDTTLEHFNIEHDKSDLIPMIKEAQEISPNGFKIIASPWTAPPWMKTNNAWNGGKLKKEYFPTWANYFSKYISAYEKEGIDIWAITVENEPLGNDSNWESMHFTPEEMGHFVKNHLGPKFEEDKLNQKILVYDQNRGKELKEWADVLLTNESLDKYIYGTAVHWYTSTNDVMEESLNYAHEVAPSKSIIQTEGCIDSEVPHWKEDKWYWSKEATDWGYDWALEEDKKDHPKYVPVYRYARDMIGCLNNWVEGWVDWNMILDRQGGPNLAKNWCIAPVIVDVERDEVYYTPLYYTMMHFSKFIRPGAARIDYELTDKDLLASAVLNEDGSIVLVVLNMMNEARSFELKLKNRRENIKIVEQGLQTILIKAENI